MHTATSNYLSLARSIVIRDFKGQYRKSVLGPLWVILQPILYLIIFGFIRGVLNIPSDGVPYAVFLYTGLVPYLYLSATINRGMMSVHANASVIKKMSVRGTVFPFAALGNTTIDVGFMFLVQIALMLAFGIVPGPTAILVIPLFALVGLMGYGIALGLAGIGTFRTDIFMVVPYALQVILLASPIIYPISQVPEKWLWLYQFNPMVGIMDSFRQVLLHNALPDPVLLGISCAWVAAILLVTLPAFRYLSRYFSDVLA